MRRIFLPAAVFLCLTLASTRQVIARAQVIDVGWEYVFGDQIVFRVELESEDSIDDAWIFIRASGKNQPIYGELVVVQENNGASVLEYVQDLAVEPLPAFSSIEYWVDIKLAGGEVLSSPKESFLYVDNQKDWQVLDEQPFRIHWYEGDVDAALEILDVARNSLKQAEKLASLQLVEMLIFSYTQIQVRWLRHWGWWVSH